eukprot:4041940-Amphidinium_carterae.1
MLIFLRLCLRYLSFLNYFVNNYCRWHVGLALDESVWEPALSKGRGRGPIRHLKTLANRVGWVPHPPGWQCGEQIFTWQDADWKIKHDLSRALLAEVTSKRPDFAGLETGLSNQALRHLKKGATQKDERTSAALNAAHGGVWHEVRAHKAFIVGETCVRCQAEPEDVSHILFRCPHWRKERRDVELPADDDTTPPCVETVLTPTTEDVEAQRKRFGSTSQGASAFSAKFVGSG